MLEFVAECTPEGHRSQIIDSDNCVQPDRAAVLETPLARTHEACCEPAAPVIWVNDQPIEAASPPVPRCDERSNRLSPRIDNEQGLWIEGQERAQRLNAVGRCRRGICEEPQVEHGIKVVRCAIVDVPSAQARIADS